MPWTSTPLEGETKRGGLSVSHAAAAADAAAVAARFALVVRLRNNFAYLQSRLRKRTKTRADIPSLVESTTAQVRGTSYVVVVIGPLDGIDIYVSLTGHHMLSSLSDH